MKKASKVAMACVCAIVADRACCFSLVVYLFCNCKRVETGRDPMVSLKEKTDDDMNVASAVNSNRGAKYIRV